MIGGLSNVSGNDWRVSGKQPYFKRTVKTAVVGGETYSKTVCENSVFDYDQDFESEERSHYWRLVEFSEYDFLGIPTRKIWDYNGWEYSSALTKICSTEQIYSQNWYAQVNCFLLEKGFFGEKIISAGAGKYHTAYRVEIENLLTYEGFVEVNVFGYGSGLSVVINISLDDFLGMDFSKWPSHKKKPYYSIIPEMEKAKTFFTDEEKLIISFRLFQSLINSLDYGNQHKQRTF